MRQEQSPKISRSPNPPESLQTPQTNSILPLPTVGRETNESRICITCGTQFPPNPDLQLCAICTDDRQYIPQTGQKWTTHSALLNQYTVEIVELTDHLYELVIRPTFAIGQRAFLVISDNGNILWDCIPLLDPQAIEFIKSKGGLKAIAISHPHYYSNMNYWAETFNCPIYLHAADQEYIVDKGSNVKLWNGNEFPLWDGVEIINIGGHFPGSSVLRIPALSPRGTILCGDTLYLAPSKKHFAVMYSYPNRIPLPLHEVNRIKARFENISFDTIYGFYSYQNLMNDAKAVLSESFRRYSP